jgi:uncharacterized membrane protein HdeD (DUF308 family)
MDPTADMAQALARNWWAFALRGALAIIFGILAFAWPAMTLAVLVLLFGAYVFVDGVLALLSAFQSRGHVRRWWMLVVLVLRLRRRTRRVGRLRAAPA